MYFQDLEPGTPGEESILSGGAKLAKTLDFDMLQFIVSPLLESNLFSSVEALTVSHWVDTRCCVFFLITVMPSRYLAGILICLLEEFITTHTIPGNNSCVEFSASKYFVRYSTISTLPPP
uniref:Uncharacterized protein n=1 Tax=Cacopsylla melanoneura TaxID=428564 RepID=A0A8D8YQC4_9HEMI